MLYPVLSVRKNKRFIIIIIIIKKEEDLQWWPDYLQICYLYYIINKKFFKVRVYLIRQAHPNYEVSYKICKYLYFLESQNT